VCCYLGSPVRTLSPQHGGFHLGQRAQLAQLTDDPSTGSAHVRSVNVRSKPRESPADGSADPHAPRLQGVRLQSGRRIPEVISHTLTISSFLTCLLPLIFSSFSLCSNINCFICYNQAMES
jgi:hypothetical protein